MFRKINLKKDNKDKIILMKNIKEPICEIPQEYVTNISYNLNDVNKMNIEVPNKTTRYGETVFNPM